MITTSAKSSGFQKLPWKPDPALCEAASELALKNASTWTYCGPLLSENSDSLPTSYSTWSRATVVGPLTPALLSLLEYVHKVLRNADIAHYWLTIRASQATKDYDIPRWHTDENFFLDLNEKNLCEEGQWKLISTILGPGTLFLQNGKRGRALQGEIQKLERARKGEHVCTTTQCLGCASVAEAVRARLAEALKGESFYQAAQGDCVLLRTSRDKGALHSEPPIHSDRIFVNIIPGNEAELAALMRKWGMSFPRSWSVGVPSFLL